MEIEKLKAYIPFIAMSTFIVFAQYNMFVTPSEMAEMHVRILTEIEQKYATKSDAAFLHEQFKDMKIKIDKIYDKMIGGN